jgi:hypothetical protein
MRKFFSVLLMAGLLYVPAQAASADYYEPGSSCTVHWMPDGSLRVKLYNYTYRGAYVTCYYDLWVRGQWPHEHWKSRAWVRGRHYRYVYNYKARRYDWVNVTGSSIA